MILFLSQLIELSSYLTTTITHHTHQHSDFFPPLVGLGDNIGFFFKCNAGLEPDNCPKKESSLQKKIFDSSQFNPYI